MTQLDVVVASPHGDEHANQVLEAIDDLGATGALLSASSIVDAHLEWRPGSPLELWLNDARWMIDDRTTVWWRRPDVPAVEGFGALEGRLIADEVGVLVPGLLEAVGVRWVDPPWIQMRARLKVLQLSLVHATRCRVPETIVTGSETAAVAFASNRRTVAKAVSSGVGIAPYVDVVPTEELHRVEVCPTMLQGLVEADADIRLVTVGSSVFCWSRPRQADEPPDWRATDPMGSGFRPMSRDITEGVAGRIAASMGLSFSVQDWLQREDQLTFLEVNTQGQWLFLDDASGAIVPALAAHLVGST